VSLRIVAGGFPARSLGYASIVGMTENEKFCPTCGSPMQEKFIPRATPAINEQPPKSPELIQPMARLECARCHHAEGRHLKQEV
jgi:ribosomal protein S27AE